MSMDKIIYLGPFLVCKYHLVKDTRHDPGCPKCGKVRLGKSFCETCGSRIESIEVKFERPSVENFNDVLGEDDVLRSLVGEGDEMAADRNEEWLAPNEGRNAPRRFGIGESGIQFDLPQNIEPERTWFESAYAAEIDKLRKAYDLAEVRWGCVVYWS